eukprot:jgi/Botrbrau1/16155/Bobra.0309s0005.1
MIQTILSELVIGLQRRFTVQGMCFHLLHIVEEPHMIHIWPGMYLPPDDDAEEEEVEEAVKMVRRRFTKLLASRKIPFDVSIVVAGTEPSQVATVIRDKADEIKASAVVMARHPENKVPGVLARICVC